MRIGRMHGLVGSLLAVAGVTVSAPVCAQDPLVVVVEVKGGELDAGAIRSAISEALGRPVLSPFDEGADAVGSRLTLVLDREQGRARAEHRSGTEVTSWATDSLPEEADGSGLWLVPHAVAVVRAAAPAQQGRPEDFKACVEVLDPWGKKGQIAFERAGYRLPPEVLNPFEDMPYEPRPRAPYRLPSEVLDPWEREERDASPAPESTESGRALDAPESVPADS